MPDKLPFSVLIVDDEPNIRSGLAKGLANEVDFVETASSVHEAIEKFDAGDYQLVITDVRMPGEMNGLDLVSLVRQRKPDTTSIVITAHGTVE
ncbi:MAG: response regulator transcription factor, partial [Planctomycetota bacterium]